MLGEDCGVEGRGVARAGAGVGCALGGGVGGEGFLRGCGGGWHFDLTGRGAIEEWVLRLEMGLGLRRGRD